MFLTECAGIRISKNSFHLRQIYGWMSATDAKTKTRTFSCAFQTEFRLKIQFLLKKFFANVYWQQRKELSQKKFRIFLFFCRFTVPLRQNRVLVLEFWFSNSWAIETNRFYNFNIWFVLIARSVRFLPTTTTMSCKYSDKSSYSHSSSSL